MLPWISNKCDKDYDAFVEDLTYQTDQDDKVGLRVFGRAAQDPCTTCSLSLLALGERMCACSVRMTIMKSVSPDSNSGSDVCIVYVFILALFCICAARYTHCMAVCLVQRTRRGRTLSVLNGLQFSYSVVHSRPFTKEHPHFGEVFCLT